MGSSHSAGEAIPVNNPGHQRGCCRRRRAAPNMGTTVSRTMNCCGGKERSEFADAPTFASTAREFNISTMPTPREPDLQAGTQQNDTTPLLGKSRDIEMPDEPLLGKSRDIEMPDEQSERKVPQLKLGGVANSALPRGRSQFHVTPRDSARTLSSRQGTPKDTGPPAQFAPSTLADPIVEQSPADDKEEQTPVDDKAEPSPVDGKVPETVDTASPPTESPKSPKSPKAQGLWNKVQQGAKRRSWLKTTAAPKLDTAKAARMAEVLKRNQVEIGTYILLRDTMEFTPIKRGEEPVAKLRYPGKSRLVLDDVAKVMKVYNRASFVLEGHTATPEDKIDEWSHRLAMGRAQEVKTVIGNMGVEPKRIHLVSRPGLLGNAHRDIVIKVASFVDPDVQDAGALANAALPPPPVLDAAKHNELATILNNDKVEIASALYLKQFVEFHLVKRGEDPNAVFTEPDKQKKALGDVAEVLKIYDTAEVLIEGHTATPADKMDDWAFQLAGNRAELVKTYLVDHGIKKGRITCVPLPGHLGNNKSDIVILITHVDDPNLGSPCISPRSSPHTSPQNSPRPSDRIPAAG